METISKVERFIDSKNDDKKVWISDGIEMADGSTSNVFSGCIRVEGESFNLDTGFVTERKAMVWVKAPNEKSLDNAITRNIKLIEAGKRVPHVRYSVKPYYDGQDPDINPRTGDIMVDENDNPRYSRIALTTKEAFDTVDRQYEANPVQAKVATPDVKGVNETT